MHDVSPPLLACQSQRPFSRHKPRMKQAKTLKAANMPFSVAFLAMCNKSEVTALHRTGNYRTRLKSVLRIAARN